MKDKDLESTTPSSVAPESLEEMEQLAEQMLEKGRDLAKKLPILGHVIWLYTQSAQYKHLFIQDIESRILTPILLEQCKLYVQTKTGGLPIAFFSWAKLSEEVEKKYLATQRIAPNEWRTGDRIWLVDVVTPFSGPIPIYREICDEVHPGKEVSLLFPSHKGGTIKTTLSEIIEKSRKIRDFKSKVSTRTPNSNPIIKH